MQSKPPVAAVVVIAVALVAGVAFWYWQSKKSVPSGEESLGAQIFEKAQNPLKDELPETNPFKVETNPFSGAETNPLKGVIKNPF